MARTVSAFSNKQTQEDKVQDILAQIDAGGKNPELIIFTGTKESFGYFAFEIKKRYPGATSIGTTSFIDMNDKGDGQNCFSALAIFSGVEIAAGILFEINRHPKNYITHVKNAVNSLSTYDNTCCLEFSTAFSNGEELVLDTFEEAFEGKNITILGSSAGCVKDTETYVALNGDIYINTCVFCLIHNLEGRITYYRENIFKPTNLHFITTDVDCEERIVYCYNERTAANILAEEAGVSLEGLPEYLNLHPMGRLVDGDVYITESSSVNEDGSISYYSRIYNRTHLALLEVDDIEKVWEKTAENINQKITKHSFSIVINCLSRMKLFKSRNIFEKYTENLKNNYGTYIGVCGFGEQLNYTHLNQSMVIAVFE